jgi:hypothetical protein
MHLGRELLQFGGGVGFRLVSEGSWGPAWLLGGQVVRPKGRFPAKWCPWGDVEVPKPKAEAPGGGVGVA